MSLSPGARFTKLKEKAAKYVLPYSIKIKLAHIEFIDQAWPTSAKRKDPDYLKWKFRSESAEEIKNLLVAVDQQKVVGHLGLIPAMVVIGGKIYDAQWGCNFKVLPGFEGAGYGSLLDIQSLDIKTITLGAAPTKQSEDIKIKLGFKKLEGPRVMVYPIQFQPFIKMKLASIPSLFLNFLSTVLKIFFNATHIQNYFEKNSQFALAGSYRDVIDLVAKFQKTLPYTHIKHDVHYLNWRCQTIEGYRSEAQSLQTANGSFILYYCSAKYCYLHEFNFISDTDRNALLKRLLRIAIQKKCSALYVYSNTVQEEKGFKHFGFLGFRRKINIYAYSQEQVEFGTRFYMTTYDSDVNL